MGVKSILGIKSRCEAYKILNALQDLGYLTYTLDWQTKQLTYRITDWIMKCSGAACKEGAVYASTGYGFIGMPRNITVDKGYKFEPCDAWLSRRMMKAWEESVQNQSDSESKPENQSGMGALKASVAF